MISNFFVRTSLLVLLLGNVAFSHTNPEQVSFIQDGPCCSHVPVLHERRTAFANADYSSWYKVWKYTSEAFKQACSGGFAIFKISFTSNFDEVMPGVVYRCAQPSVADIDQYVKMYKIKTVLNLRSEMQTQKKYQELWKSLCAKLQQLKDAGISVHMINIPLDNMTIINPSILEKILEVIDTIKDGTGAPALIHCESGSGRTGMVSALYRIETEEATLEQVLAELDRYKYFHIEELYPNVKYFIRLWFDLRKNKKLSKDEALEAYRKIYYELPLIEIKES